MAILGASIEHIAQLEGTRLKQVSPAYRTQAWGVVDQPDFINAVVAVDTTQNPRQLLENLLKIERELGRTRNGLRWGPRLIDLDLLVFSDLQLNEPDLVVPHPRLQQRAFVLAPLNDLSPALQVPGRGTVGELLLDLEEADRNSVQILAEWSGSDWNIIEREVS